MLFIVVVNSRDANIILQRNADSEKQMVAIVNKDVKYLTKREGREELYKCDIEIQDASFNYMGHVKGCNFNKKVVGWAKKVWANLNKEGVSNDNR